MIRALWVFFALLVGVYLCGPLVDPDLWWHITIGKWILAHKEFPVVDHWTMFWQGKPWFAYSWSSEIFFAATEKIFGQNGLVALQVMLALLIAFSFLTAISILCGDWFFGALLGALTTVSCVMHYTLRPQSIVWILLAWLIVVADKIEREGLTAKRAALLILIMCVWANTHITTLLGLGTVFLWTVSVPTLIIAFLGTLITPYFGAEWLIFFSKSSTPFEHSAIIEFGPANIMQYPTGFLILLGALLLSFLFYKRDSIAIPKIVLALGFVVGALAVVKFIPFAVIILASLIAVLWRDAKESGDTLGNFSEGFEKLRLLTYKIAGPGLAFLFLAMMAVRMSKVISYPLNTQFAPKAALDFIIESNLKSPLMNSFGDGGYVMYRRSNDSGEIQNPVSIDGRTNVIPAELFKAHDFALNGKQKWIDYIEIVKPETILWRNQSPLVSILLERKEWQRVFTDAGDEGFSVFVRQATQTEHN